MRRILALVAVCLLLLGGCDVPKPPPELPTPAPGSQNPEVAPHTTQVRPTPDRGFTPLPVGPGHIYFVRGERLWTINPDGSGERQLSEMVATGRPQPSPDGKLVAWVGGRDIYVMQVDVGGGVARSVYSGAPAARQRLGWSADSALLGFVTFDPAAVGVEKGWAVPAAGGEPMLLAEMKHGLGDRPATYEPTVQWSPDGKWVIVSGTNNPSVLRRWPLSTGRAGDVQEIAGGEPDWSPDSATLLYTESLNGAVLIYGVLQAKATPFRDEQQFAGTGVGEYGQGPGPLWSPASVGADSDLLAYRSRTSGAEPVAVIRRRSGKSLAPLPPLTNNPAWSPTGDRLVVERGTMTQETFGLKWVPNSLALVSVNLSGEHEVRPLVENGAMPSWGK